MYSKPLHYYIYIGKTAPQTVFLALNCTARTAKNAVFWLKKAQKNAKKSNFCTKKRKKKQKNVKKTQKSA